MRLYRVVPVDPTAKPGKPFSPLYVPPATGRSRIDNPGRYDALYLGTAAAGAVAEAFGRFARWGDYLLEHPQGFTRRLVSYDTREEVAVLDLDDASELVRLDLRPSQVVTREREVTQAWALRVFEEGRWGGVSWWSYYDARWSSVGLWANQGLRINAIETLTGDHPAVVEAAAVLLRTWG